MDVMAQYGLLLEKFQDNGQFVNDSIFTMMHHVGADAEGVATLFQPSILKTFSLICESDFQLSDVSVITLSVLIYFCFFLQSICFQFYNS